MKNKKLTVTIGIPAYNEEQNIGHLLLSILRQKTKDIILKEILVISDGSTDVTASIVSSFTDKRIHFIHHSNRKGKTSIDNEIVSLADSDILVMLDGDVLPKGDKFLQAICEPILNDSKIGLVGGEIHPSQPDSFFERVIAYSHIVKRHLFKQLQSGDTIYLCHGRARAFSKDLYKTMEWPLVCPEDAYSYLYCKNQGFSFAYEKRACVFFRAPTNFVDHAKQSKRFVAGRDMLKKYFPEEMILSSYSIPKSILVNTALQFFLRAPISCLMYCLIQFYVRFVFHSVSYTRTYDTSRSTKRLVSWSKHF